MKRVLLRGWAVLPLALAVPAFAAEFFVSPTGSPYGNGSISAPWDLVTALKQPAAVRPGDTIWLRGGTYRPGLLQPSLTGTAGAPIVVRNYRNERAIIDGAGNPYPVIGISGAYTWYWGLEITNSDTNRVFADHYSCYPQCRPDGVLLVGPGVKAINLIVHNAGSGIYMNSNAVNAEAYGNIIFNQGWQGDRRGHGHGIYAQNQTGTMRIVDNIIFNGFHSGVHAFGTSQAFINNMHMEGNVIFGNGLLARDPTGWGILVGGSVEANNILVRGNHLFNPSWYSRSSNLDPSYGSGTTGLTVQDNYSAGPWALRYTATPEQLTETGNQLWGRTPTNTNVATPLPASPTVIVRPNQYEPTRATIVVYNGGLLGQVSADVSRVLLPGDTYELRDVQNFFGAPVRSGTYSGGTLAIPMTSAAIAAPVGNVPRVPTHTDASFGAFVLLRTNTRSTDNTGSTGGASVPSGYSMTIEAETAVLTSPMVSLAQPGASQGRIVASTRPNQGTAVFTFDVPAAGTYALWAKVLARSASFDSFFVSVDGGTEQVFEVGGNWSNAYQWRPVTTAPSRPWALQLTAGRHTLRFRGREEATGLDVIHLTTRSDVTASQLP